MKRKPSDSSPPGLGERAAFDCSDIGGLRFGDGVAALNPGVVEGGEAAAACFGLSFAFAFFAKLSIVFRLLQKLCCLQEIRRCCHQAGVIGVMSVANRGSVTRRASNVIKSSDPAFAVLAM